MARGKDMPRLSANAVRQLLAAGKNIQYDLARWWNAVSSLELTSR
jgi:hypothetical protein